MTDARVIETVYRGYRFRSRLEARWAVFFDALGLPFEYEKEGFDLGDGTWYLPDFWLPALKLWVEIKGELDFIDHENSTTYSYFSHPVIQLMRSFRDNQQWPVACIIGQPGEHSICFFAWDETPGSFGCYEDHNSFWCVSNGRVTLNVNVKSPSREIHADIQAESLLEHFTYARDYGYVVEPIENALLHARQARFEHGEKPRIR